jgi:hypothetical protein
VIEMHLKGPWSKDRIDRFLAEKKIPIRLACNGKSGCPVMASLWFMPMGDTIWCATQSTASLVSLLERDPQCAFEVADDHPPYSGVRVQGVATLHPERGESVLRDLIDRYLGDSDAHFASWLLERAGNETAIALAPRMILSWDYTERMAHAV